MSISLLSQISCQKRDAIQAVRLGVQMTETHPHAYFELEDEYWGTVILHRPVDGEKWIATKNGDYCFSLDELPTDAKLRMDKSPVRHIHTEEPQLKMLRNINRSFRDVVQLYQHMKGVELSKEEVQRMLEQFLWHLSDVPNSPYWIQLSKVFEDKPLFDNEDGPQLLMLVSDLQSHVFDLFLHNNPHVIHEDYLCQNIDHYVLWHKNISAMCSIIDTMFYTIFHVSLFIQYAFSQGKS
jgi:hypothetical protein